MCEVFVSHVIFDAGYFAPEALLPCVSDELFCNLFISLFYFKNNLKLLAQNLLLPSFDAHFPASHRPIWGQTPSRTVGRDRCCAHHTKQQWGSPSWSGPGHVWGWSLRVTVHPGSLSGPKILICLGTSSGRILWELIGIKLCPARIYIFFYQVFETSNILGPVGPLKFLGSSCTKTHAKAGSVLKEDLLSVQ